MRARTPALRIFVAVHILCALMSQNAAGQACGTIVYENRNQIDYGPLAVSAVQGIVMDSTGTSIPKTCVGVFTEADHKLVGSTETGADGRFDLKSIPSGTYRLLVSCEGFCVANARIHVLRSNGRRKALTVHMKTGGVDSCSYIDQK